MKIFRIVCSVLLAAFLLFTPKLLYRNAQREFVDARFVRNEDRLRGTIMLYHIVRHKPYLGSLSAWLQKKADAYEKKHRGTYIAVEGMDEKAFAERLAYGRRADAYSFFSGSVYRDLLQPFSACETPLREGLFCTDRCAPYCYTGYCKLTKDPQDGDGACYYANDVLAARLQGGADGASEEKAQTLFTDLRRAGDLIRYRDGFALSELSPVDPFTDAVCWIGVDRDTSAEKAASVAAFVDWLLLPEQQQSLDALGMFSVRADVRSEPPESRLKEICKTYASVETVDPFRWHDAYDALSEDAAAARGGDGDAAARFTKRLQELTGWS